MIRIGHGYDVHRLVHGRALIIGGVDIPYEYGLLGHSDADVLLHAICDAILGALALGDIGKHFPDTDPAYHGIDSMRLLERVVHMSETRGYQVDSLDSTIVAERPKLLSYLGLMRHNIALACKTEAGKINIKATTTEGLGAIGRGEGIAAHAVVLLNAL